MKAFRPFRKARPVWPRALSEEKNTRLSFHATISVLPRSSLRVRVAATSSYRLWVNGVFRGHGPARTAPGFARVDEWVVPCPAHGSARVVIEAAHYGVATFCEALDSPFCCVEVEVDGQIPAWTGAPRGGFEVERRRECVQRVERYSYQRAFCEGYRFGLSTQSWLARGYRPSQTLEQEIVRSPRSWLAREMAYPSLHAVTPRRKMEQGQAVQGPLPASVKTRQIRYLQGVPKISQGFLLSEREWPLYETLACLVYTRGENGSAQALGQGQWLRWDFGRVHTGFPAFALKASRKARILVLFDEILIDDRIQFDRLDCLNAFWLEVEKDAAINFLAFEPYCFRYLQVILLEGTVAISDLHLRDYGSSAALRPAPCQLPSSLRSIRNAALETFRQNSLDLFMDCPSRERAGWLCDSLFTARAEWHLCGDNPIERAFLENYLRPRVFANLPPGMVPMCYPAEVIQHEYIPNWAMFLVLQLDEARRRRRLPTAWDGMIARRVRGLLRFFRGYENELGLLEKLPGWVFVEWSEATRFVQDVNFPTNMLYAAMLDASARLLSAPALARKAAALRKMILSLAWRDGRFVDNAVRSASGELEPTGSATEVAQYYAFFFGLVSPRKKEELWKRLVREDYGDLRPANAFIGKLLRLELLVQNGETRAAHRELTKNFRPMAQRTGTLWEHLDPRASCNHGFTSYIAVLLDRLARSDKSP